MYLSEIHPSEMGKEEFVADFEYLFDFLRENYPYFDVKERMLGYDWLSFENHYMDRINT